MYGSPVVSRPTFTPAAVWPWRPFGCPVRSGCPAPPLLQLAILAAAAIDAAADDAAIAACLAVYAGGRAGERAAAGLGNLLAAFHAVVRAFAGREACAGRQHAVGYGVVDLVGNRP